MKKFVIAVICLSLIAVGHLYAQENEIDHIKVSSAIDQLNVNANNLTSVDLTSKALVGSPYIIKEFQSGQILGQQMVYAFRYDAYNDNMEVELQGKAYLLPMKISLTIEFLNSGKIYEVLRNEPGSATESGFYIPHLKGEKISLYLKERIKFYEEVPAKLGFSKYEPPKLKRIKDVLYVVKDQTAFEVPKKKKEFLKFFPDSEKAIESFMKKEKINVKKEEDLTALIRYYNSLN